ncbi:hypothetical protein FDJ70_05710 [Clostridium botulinum]|nr:hypothetical protein [Clostridium botulinum]
MGRLAKLKPIEVKVRLEDYIHFLLGEKKTGKSTLFRDLIHKHYNGDMSKGILFGFEPGQNALDGLYSPQVEDWEDWEDWVDELVEERTNTTFRMVGIDTVDEFLAMAEDKTMRDSKKKDGKVVESINSAFGGFGRGKKYCINLMRESILKLKRSGYGLCFVAHTKLKKKNTGAVLSSEEEYMQLSCALTDDYAGLFENMADMITYLVVDKTVVGDGDDVKHKTARRSVSMHFRSDGEIDCGGRFKELPYSLSYSVDNYLKAFEQGVKSSILKPVTDEDIQEMAKKQEIESEKQAEEKTRKLTIEEMVNTIKQKFGELGDGAKLKMQEYVEETQVSSLDELTEKHRDTIEKMYKLVL